MYVLYTLQVLVRIDQSGLQFLFCSALLCFPSFLTCLFESYYFFVHSIQYKLHMYCTMYMSILVIKFMIAIPYHVG